MGFSLLTEQILSHVIVVTPFPLATLKNLGRPIFSFCLMLLYNIPPVHSAVCAHYKHTVGTQKLIEMFS